jgi:hypothetical protein
MRKWTVILCTAAALFVGAACDDDAGETVNQIQEKAGEAGARGVAEAYRGAIKAEGANNNKDLCRPSVLQEAAENLPGDPDIQFSNGDGECYAQVTVSDQSACVTVPKSGDNVDVSGGTCPSQ